MDIKNIPKSVKEVLQNDKYLFLFVLFSAIVLSIYVLVPFLINQKANFVSYSTPRVFLIIIFSFFIGLLFTMQVYSIRKNKELNIVAGSGGILGFLSGFAIILFSSATCIACLSVILTFLGVGTVFTLFNYRNYIIIIGFLLILISLYLISNKIQKQCELCKIQSKFIKRQKTKRI